MATKKLEVNHDLINTKFQSYRYNRDIQCSVASKCLPDGSKLQTFKLNNSDYSYCHVAMSSGLNDLYHDRFDATKVYLITNRGEIVTSIFDKAGSDQLGLKSVFTIPDFNAETTYASLSFPSESKAIVLLSSKQSLQKVNVHLSDKPDVHLERNYHQVKLFILKRSTLKCSENWDIEFSLDIPQKCLYSDLNIVVSSHLHLYDSILSDGETLSLVIGSVYECFHVDTTAKNDKSKLKSLFGAIFHQIQLHHSQHDSVSKWSIAENKRFVDDARTSNDFPKYAFLGNNSDIVFVSNFRLKYKRIDPVILDFEDILTPDEVLFIAAGDLLEKEAVDEEALKEVERVETEAIKKAKFTKAVFDEYETCDLTDSASSLLMTRFDCRTGNVLQEFDLSSQQWLFSMTNYSEQNRLPFFVTRHDVDAFIYEPQSIMATDAGLKEETFTVKHIDSFPAFGYVFASKQHRRFVTFCQTISSSSTVFNSALIDNWIDQLLYVYSKPLNQESPNGQQFLFYYNNETPKKTDRSIINGLCALPTLSTSINEKSPNSVYVLTEDTLYLIQF